MHRPPRDPAAPLFTTGFVAWSLLQGVVVLAVVAGLFVSALDRLLPDDEARALAFAALVATNAGLVLVDRAGGASLVAAFRRPNPHPVGCAGHHQRNPRIGNARSRRRANCLVSDRCIGTI